MGYVMTDENRWQYQQVVEIVSSKKEEKQENKRKESTIKLA